MDKPIDFPVPLLNSRQRDMMPPELSGLWVLVVGLGGIGSNTVNILQGMGIRNIIGIDPDVVDPENLWPGWFLPTDVGRKKVDVMHERAAPSFVGYGVMASDILPLKADITILATDSLVSRREAAIIQAEAEQTEWFIDARMGGRGATVYTFRSSPSAVYEYHVNKKMTGGDVDLPCGMKATAALTKGWIPGMIGDAVVAIASGEEPPYLQTYSIGGELLKANPPDLEEPEEEPEVNPNGNEHS